MRAIRERAGIEDERLARVPTPQLVDILAQCLRVPQPLMARIYAEVDIRRRAHEVLAAHVGLPDGASGERNASDS